MSLEAEEQEDAIGDGNETSKRSERKRQREKQRRSDLSSAFDELAAFIVHVEPDAGELDVDSKKKRKKSGEGEDTTGITRLDLIGRALKIMKRLHRENEERKGYIASMYERGSGGGGPHGSNDNVLVVVPSLAPVSDDSYPVARASYPPPYSHSSGYYQGSSLPHPPPEYPGSFPPGRPPPRYPPPTWNNYRAPHPDHPPPHHSAPPPGSPRTTTHEHPSSPSNRRPL